MAWMAANLFVSCSETTRAVKAIEKLLEGVEHRADVEGFDDLPPPLVVCPAHEGWVAVTGAGPWIDDLTWAAERLAATCDGPAVSCELVANCYRLRLAHYSPNKRERLLCTPDEDWGKEPDTKAPMPRYEDVEQLAFATLREIGIPPCLITVGTRPFDVPEGGTDLGQGVTLLRSADGDLERGELAIELPTVPTDQQDAPVLPTRTSEDFGLMLFEDRYLEGVPTDEALSRLFELEEAYGERARRRAAEPDKVSLTFSYFAGPHQDKLDVMLQAHDRHTVASVTAQARLPWWQFWRYFGRLR